MEGFVKTVKKNEKENNAKPSKCLLSVGIIESIQNLCFI